MLTSHVDIPFDDLWCLSPSGEMLRVQVKTASKSIFERPTSKVKAYRFTMGRHLTHYEGIYIFVALDIRKCLAKSFDGKLPATFRIPEGKFTDDAELESIEREFSL